MAEKNIEINIKTEDGYDVLYPKSIATNIYMDANESQTIEQKIDNIYVDDTFEIGDILCTCKSNVSSKWLECNGSMVNNANLSSILDSLDWDGTWSSYNVSNIRPTATKVGSIFSINNQFFMALSESSGNSEIRYIYRNIPSTTNWELFLTTDAMSSDNYLNKCGYVTDADAYVFIFSSNTLTNSSESLIYSKKGLTGSVYNRTIEHSCYTSSQRSEMMKIAICDSGIYYCNYFTNTTNGTRYGRVSFSSSGSMSNSTNYWTSTEITLYGTMVGSNGDSALIVRQSNSNRLEVYALNFANKSRHETNTGTYENGEDTFWDQKGHRYYLRDSKVYYSLGTSGFISKGSFTNYWGDSKPFYDDSTNMYYGAIGSQNSQTLYKGASLTSSPSSLQTSYNLGASSVTTYMFRNGNVYWMFASNSSIMYYILVPQVILPNMESQSTNGQKEKYYIKAEL